MCIHHICKKIILNKQTNNQKLTKGKYKHTKAGKTLKYFLYIPSHQYITEGLVVVELIIGRLTGS
jgi:hypothetical protein